MFESPCKHFGSCGGCSTDATYQEQLSKKQEVVKELFTSFEAKIHPILSSPLIWNYRNKMEYSFRESLKKERFLGLMAKRGRVVSLSECHLAPLWFQRGLDAMAKFWDKSALAAYHHFKDSGSLRTLTFREGVRTGEKMALLTISGNPHYPFQDSMEAPLVEHLLEAVPLDTIILRQQIICRKIPTRFEEKILLGKGFIHEALMDRSGRALVFKIKPASFFQPNTLQSEILYRRALDLAELSSEETLFDLYCGTGTIGLFAAPYVKKVVGIELNKDAVDDGRFNISVNGISNMEIFEGDIASFAFDERPDGVVVDPPRSGLSPQALVNLLFLKPKKIIYISCNPKTQLANVQELVKNGYKITAIQPVDQFPHTPHIENIIALVQAF